MFWHNFKYSLKILFRNKMMIFWTFAFPIILGTFFKLAFSNIENSEKLAIFDVAVVETDGFLHNEVYKKVFDSLSDESKEDAIFRTAYVDEEGEAKDLLREKEIVGYVVFDDTPRVVIGSNGIEQTVLKTVVQELAQNSFIYSQGIELGYKEIGTDGNYNLEEAHAGIFAEIDEAISKARANIEDISNENMSYTMIEFYTLIAMTCLYGGMLGMYAINQNLADMSKKGRRVAVSPSSKSTLILSSLLAGYITQIVGLALLFCYTIFALGVDYGPNMFDVMILALIGSLAGLSLGVAIATIFKTNEDTKMGIIVAVTMLGCFFSGMMGITMKYVIDANVPILNVINPANMITDGLYSLYYYIDKSRYYFNLASILVFSLVMVGLAIHNLRRKRYDSI